MNPIRRLTAALAGLAGALLAFAAVAPAALAQPFPPRPPGWDKHPPLPLGHVAGPVMGPNRARVPAHLSRPHRRGRRHARLADRLDRYRRRPARGHCCGAPGPRADSSQTVAVARSCHTGYIQRRTGGAELAPGHDHVFPAAHDDRTRLAAAHQAALHPLPAKPGRILGQPKARQDRAPAMVPILRRRAGPKPRRCDRVRQPKGPGRIRTVSIAAESALIPDPVVPAGVPVSRSPR